VKDAKRGHATPQEIIACESAQQAEVRRQLDLADALEVKGDRRFLARNRPKPFEAYGVKGLKSTPWRKTFKTSAALLKWCERNEAVVHGTRDLEVTR
jgi:hypothetical protein